MRGLALMAQDNREMNFRRAVRKIMKSPIDPSALSDYSVAVFGATMQGQGIGFTRMDEIINEVYLGKSKLDILYVEDDSDVAKAMLRFFEMEDVTPTHFTSAQKAVKALEKQVFDLVLTDWNLIGGETGLKVVEAARAKGLPVRVYSGNDWNPRLDPSLKDIWLPKIGNKPVANFIAEVRRVGP